MMWIPITLLAVLVFGGNVAAAPLSSPPAVTITPPTADLPADVAALSRIWEGAWDGGLPTRVAVEALEWDSAHVVYAWGIYSHVPSQAGWIRGRVAVLPGGMLQWAGRLSSTNEPVTFTFTLVKGHGHLLGERYFHETGSVSIVTMEKVAPLVFLTVCSWPH
jgi:hypothetical protein